MFNYHKMFPNFKIFRDSVLDSAEITSKLWTPKYNKLPPSVIKGELAFDTTVNKLAYFDGQVWVYLSDSGGNPDPLQNVVFVAKNGNDTLANGYISNPFLTVQAALEFAWTTYVLPVEPQPAAPFTRAVVFVCSGTYEDGNLILPPQICVQGQGGNYTRIVGDWSIDTRWSNYHPPSLPSPPSVLVPSDFRSSFLDLGIYGKVDINWNTTFSNEGKFWAQNVRFGSKASGGSITITEKVPNPSSNQAYFQSCEFLTDVTLNGCNIDFSGALFTPDPNGIGANLILNQSGNPPDLNGTNFVTTGGSFGNIIINSTNGPLIAPGTETRLGHSTQIGSTLTINGVYSKVYYNASSIPTQDKIILSSGALLTQLIAVNPVCLNGNSANRPVTPYIGEMYFDTTINRPVWYDGINWINALGAIV